MLRLETVLEATGGEVASSGGMVFQGISIDSRTMKDGELFVALKGDRLDGHDFLKDVLERGVGAIVNRNALCVIGDNASCHGLRITDYESRKTLIIVDDTLKALQDLASYLRNNFSGHVIGVAGSNGKTTTKELIASILSTKLNVLKTRGNLNNHIGMPLSMTDTDSDTEVMVLEMGTNRPGDVKELCTIARPDIGLVTNIGYEHIEGFGSLEKVRDSELEILPYVKKVVLNADDSFLLGGVSLRFKGEVITFGIDGADSGCADVSAREIEYSEKGARFVISTPEGSVSVESKLSGRFNVYNSLAAAAAAYAAGFDLDAIKKGLESFEGVAMRFRIEKCCGVTFLNDVYNANPSSMEVSLSELERLCKSREGDRNRYGMAIAVLGDMLELGDYAVPAHEKLGSILSEMPVDVLIGVGPLMKLAVAGFRGRGICVNTSEDAGAELSRIISEGDIVLIKGSRGMKMEKVFDLIAKGGPVNAL